MSKILNSLSIISQTGVNPLVIDATKLVLNTSGQLGIGLVPSYRLHVQASSNSSIIASLAPASGLSGILMEYDTANPLISLFKASDGSKTVQLYSAGDSYFSEGNFGIGTNNPTSKLYVQQSGGTMLTLKNTAGSGTSIAFVDSAGTTQLSAGASTAYQLAFYAGVNGPINFGTFGQPTSGRAGFSAPNQVMMGVSANNLNIGFGGGTYFATADPDAKIEVRGNGTTLSTFGLKVKNSAATSLLAVRDDGFIGFGTTTQPTAVNYQFNGHLNTTALSVSLTLQVNTGTNYSWPIATIIGTVTIANMVSTLPAHSEIPDGAVIILRRTDLVGFSWTVNVGTGTTGFNQIGGTGGTGITVAGGAVRRFTYSRTNLTWYEI